MEYERQFAMIMKDVEYRSGGQRFVGFLAVDETITGRRPGLLICHGGAGLDDETKDNARRIAELGYVAYALDVIGDGQVLDESSVTPRVAQLRSDPPRLRAVGLAGLDVLRKQPEVAAGQLAAIGYCFGGLVALELARAGTDLKAVIGFHSRLTSLMPQEPVRIAGKVLVCLGAEDPVIPPAERSAFEDEMNSARVNWQMNIYGGAAHLPPAARGTASA
jgi:dienelactone hydrolase